MREIKFRVWNKDSKRWEKYLSYCIDKIMPKSWHIILQYTGLKDKNGVEIYEGDICKCRDTDYLDGTYYDLLVCDDFHKFIYTVMYSEDHSGLNGHTQKDLEVIGNIYEHSHLLK